MSSRLFWKLLLTYAALNVISVVGTWLVATSPQPQGVWFVGGLSLVGLVLITGWLVSRIVKPVRQLTKAAEAMAAGNYRDPIYVASRDEVGQLAQTFNSMREEMDSRVALLRDSNQRLSTVLGGMSDGVIAIDERQHVLFANRAAGELMGFQPEEAQGKSLLESVRNHTLHALVVGLTAAPGHQQVELEMGESGELKLLVNATSLSGVQSAGVVMVINNLTEVRQLEAMRRNFVANVSHELKTPLSSIKAYAETLREGAIHDHQNRGLFVQRIEEQADRLSQLISDLLSLARIEAGTEHLNILVVQVERAVELCCQEQGRAAAAKGIELVIQAGGDQRVEVDENALRQILINLIDNAIKYTPESGTVAVGWRTEGQHVAIFVRDTGIGIPQNLQSRVFERFFRVDKARSREVGGTGLGLAIVKHLAQTFGGTVEVQSEPDQGSCFVVRLPLASSSAQPASTLPTG